jgi:O-antigen ligase
MNKVVNFISSSILCLIPVALLTGPFLPDLFISFLALFFLIFTISNKKYFYYNNIYFKFFILFCIYFIIGSYFSENPRLSFSSSLFYFRFGLFALMTKYLLENNKNLPKYFYYFLLATVLVVCFDGYYQFFFGNNILGFKIPTENRLSGFFNKEAILGSYLSKLFFLLIALHFIVNKKYSKFYNIFFWIMIISIFLLIFLSGERASFFQTVLGIIVCFIFLNYKFKYKIYFFSTVLILVIALSSIFEKNSQRMFNETISQINILVFKITDKNDQRISNYIKDKSIANSLATNQHKEHFKAAYSMFIDKPIFGYGLKMFREICGKKKYNTSIYSCTTHPHNSYLQILAEAGFIGFFFLFIPLMSIFFIFAKYLFIRNSKLYISNTSVCLLSFYLMVLWPITTNGNLFGNWLSVMYFLPAGFYLFYKKSDRI